MAHSVIYGSSARETTMNLGTNEAPFQKIWTDRKANCGNVYRVQWVDGTETGYPTEAIRDQAIEALADAWSRK
jgi:hypothetical protein